MSFDPIEELAKTLFRLCPQEEKEEWGLGLHNFIEEAVRYIEALEDQGITLISVKERDALRQEVA